MDKFSLLKLDEISELGLSVVGGDGVVVVVVVVASVIRLLLRLRINRL